MWTYPQLVIVPWGALLNESTIVGGNVSVVGIFLQHIDLQFNFLLLVLDKSTTKGEKNKVCLLTRKSLA